MRDLHVIEYVLYTVVCHHSFKTHEHVTVEVTEIAKNLNKNSLSSFAKDLSF